MTDAPLLFQTKGRQLILAGLAYFGPMRMRDATKLSGASEMDPHQVRNFAAIGAVTIYGNDRVRIITLNPVFPALEELKTLIYAVERAPLVKPTLALSIRQPSTFYFNDDGPRDLFGSWRQTAMLITIAYHGGAVSLKNLRRMQGWRASEIMLGLTGLQKRNLLVIYKERAIIRADLLGRAELIAFCNAFVAALPLYDLLPPSVAEAPTPAPTIETVSRYRYNATPAKNGERAKGLQPEEDGPPLIFGTVARFKVLVALAVAGAIRRSDLLVSTGIVPDTFDRLIRDGWIASVPYIQANRSRRAIVLASSIPAREDLVALLKVLSKWWPPKRVEFLEVVIPVSGPRVKIEKYFGASVRSQVLLTLCAMGTADVSMLERAIKNHDRQEITRSAEMFKHFGLMKSVVFDHKQPGYELDSNWHAAQELRTLLKALLEIDKRYLARARSLEIVMPHNRLQRRRNGSK